MYGRCNFGQQIAVQKNFYKQKGFTLTELLIALGIIGAIAAMSIPSLVSAIQNKLLVTQLKNSIASVQQLIGDQMVAKKTKNLKNTDFANPAKLLTNSNFAIAEECASAKECWSEDYRRLSDKGITTRIQEVGGKSVKLKNGAILSYRIATYPVLPDGDYGMAIFYIDVNGKDKPNIVGRDVFWFIVSEKGKIMNYNQAMNIEYNAEKLINQCKSAKVITGCLSVIQENGWTMPY